MSPEGWALVITATLSGVAAIVAAWRNGRAIQKNTDITALIQKAVGEQLKLKAEQTQNVAEKTNLYPDQRLATRAKKMYEDFETETQELK